VILADLGYAVILADFGYAVILANFGYAVIWADFGYAVILADLGYAVILADLGYAVIWANFGYAVILADFCYAVQASWISCSQRLEIPGIWLSNRLSMSLPDKDYSRNRSWELNYISTYLLSSDDQQFKQYNSTWEKKPKQSSFCLKPMNTNIEDHNIWRWKYRSWLGTGTKMWWG
jgi:hypothetical protein